MTRKSAVVVLALLGGLIVSAARLVTQPRGWEANADFYRAFAVTSLIVTVLTWVAAFRGSASARRPWRWIAVAFTVLLLPQPLPVIGAALDGAAPLWTIMTVLMSRLVWAPLMLAGILMFPMRRLSGQQRVRFGADIATVVGGGFVISWYFQLGPAVTSLHAGPDALVVIGFPITDLVLIFGLCALLMRNGVASWRGPLPIFLAGLTVYLAGDVIYAHDILQGPITWSTPLSLCLNGANLIMAAAAAVQAGKPVAGAAGTEERPGSAVAYLPYAALLAGYTMLLVAAVREGEIDPWGGLTAGVIVMTGAVVLRQFVALRENHRLVVHDHLTGLANRISADAALTAALRRHTDDGVASAILLIDLDGFKKVNDTRGHEAGDLLLTAFGEILKRTVRGSDVAARVGGDEFMVVLDRPGGPEQALAVARRILDATAEPVRAAGGDLMIRASVGVAMTDPGAGAATIRHRSDMAMYVAKRGGRQGVQLWHAGLEDAATADETFETDLAAAVELGQLRVLYQPLVRLSDDGIVGVEALVRWEHPTLGTIGPARFIPVAERTGVIEQIGLWVLEQATTQVRRWQLDLNQPRLYVSVNLSPRQLRQGGLVDRIRDRLTGSGLAARDLVLELTESALVNGPESVAVLEEIRDLGVAIAVDDFGTGYSSLRYLTRLPVDILKLDRCFVAELNGEPEGSAVAEAVLRLAKALHMAAVAEGIETAAQATELTLLGYDSGQGYHYARPQTAAAMAVLLARQTTGVDAGIG
ncbi:putative bifunctional diguanylate cyclase/phosphodiesterase [Actinoplanes sp. NPDC051494]|uniref:putative bifunctional diguanylate cyclase/phosphodiesterase n=1 Tax=Actinoplanes sp. NPDC051494 TaxID=3363907 RepID=UPI0037A59DFE